MGLGWIGEATRLCSAAMFWGMKPALGEGIAEDDGEGDAEIGLFIFLVFLRARGLYLNDVASVQLETASFHFHNCFNMYALVIRVLQLVEILEGLSLLVILLFLVVREALPVFCQHFRHSGSVVPARKK